MENKTMPGINRAEIKDLYESAALNGEDLTSHFQKPCVFISHKSEDIQAAEAIADYFKSHEIDVYLDKNDKNLQKATQEKNSSEIVHLIQLGLAYSTHILVLITDKTRESWWVPYEVGYAKKANRQIASLLLKTETYTEGFPDYLKVERTINNSEDFVNYVDSVTKKRSRYGDFFDNGQRYTALNENDLSILNRYIRRVQ